MRFTHILYIKFKICESLGFQAKYLNIYNKSRAHVPTQKYDFPLGEFLERLSNGKQDAS